MILTLLINKRATGIKRATAGLKSFYLMRYNISIRIFCKRKVEWTNPLNTGIFLNYMKELNFYFDFLSPFSFFAWLKLSKRQDLKVHYRPVALGPLLNHWQIKGPGEVTPKREFLLKQCLRYAAKNKIDFTTPKTHPFNSLYALRLALTSTAGDLQAEVVRALWIAGWQERIDMGSPDDLIAVLKKNGLPADELYEKSFSREAKQELKANIQEAISFGAFGVPSFVAQSELFWGHDSMDDLFLYLEGTDFLDQDKLTELLHSTPRAATQQLS